MITISENAASRITDLMQQNSDTQKGVRVSVISGGCSGLSYQLDFQPGPQPQDEQFVDKGIPIWVDKKSFFYLIGTELDYTEGLNGKGFHFKNPNASRTCGCGESFSL